MRNKRIPTILVAIVFVCMFLVGLLYYQDYGISVDEPIQRDHSLITYRYIMQQVFHRDVKELAGLPDLQEYEHRYYGTFLQLPMVFLEDLNNFQTDLGDVYRTRHLITFIYCFIGYLCFYWLGKRVFRNRGLALLGSVMLYLYPRFFATQFFYIKDMLFTASVMVAMWATVLFLEKEEKPFYGLVFCVAAAICSNLRFIGMMFPALLVGYLFIRDFFLRKIHRKGAPAVFKRVLTYVALTVGFLGIYVAIHPACWDTPLRSIVAVVQRFAYYDRWQGSSLFMGHEVYWDAIPWSYIPVWLLISLPVWYQLLFFCAVCLSALLILLPKRVEKKLALLQDTLENPTWLGVLLSAPYRYILLALALFFCPLLLVIVNNSVLYNDWRQMYFLLVPYVFLVQFALSALFRMIHRKWLRIGLVAAICVSLVFQAGWIVKNHPFEHQYLNQIAAPYRKDFSRDITRTSIYNSLKYLLAHAEEKTIVLDSTYGDFNIVQFQFWLLSPEDQARIRYEPGGMYEIADYRFIPNDDVAHDGYEPWYTIYVEGCPISCVLKNPTRSAD